MAFGQQSGPQANHRQLKTINELLAEAGFAGLKDARGSYQLTQRQAGGKFTVDEADALIERLEAEQQDPAADSVDPVVPAAPKPRMSAAEKALAKVSDELLAAELQRRGWVVMEP